VIAELFVILLFFALSFFL